jgi:hypothetical protein
MNLLQFKLRLVASDNLNENYTTVIIHINDVNDNPPTFDRPTYETQITEEDDRHVPKRILQVKKTIDKKSINFIRKHSFISFTFINYLNLHSFYFNFSQLFRFHSSSFYNWLHYLTFKNAINR